LAELISLEEAQARLLQLMRPEEHHTEYLHDALGKYLSKDLRANRTQPAADLSAMDGYAICGDGPWERIGESRAGAPFDGQLLPGQCVRISTGAHMPAGSDRVLIQENAEIDGERINASEMPQSGRHVRNRGFDFKSGDVILKAGTRIGPGQLALAISAGHSEVECWLMPAVDIIDSGDELVADPERCGDDQIPASNGAMLKAMLAPLIPEQNIERQGPVADDPEALKSAFRRAEMSDIIITTGGASVGDHDHVKQAIESTGAELAFWKVAIKPGKPLMIATRTDYDGPQVFIGLPGNPVSSFVTCFLFVLPLIRSMMGDPDPLPKALPATLGVDLPAIGSRQEFLRGVWDGETVVLAASQDSSALQALAASNCLINRSPHASAASAGDRVSIYPL